jgi:hypothetical protein
VIWGGGEEGGSLGNLCDGSGGRAEELCSGGTDTGSRKAVEGVIVDLGSWAKLEGVVAELDDELLVECEADSAEWLPDGSKR